MSNFPLLSVVGIEIEYMLVDKDSLNVCPRSDEILQKLAGRIVNEVELGPICISNELIMHVLELKNNGPKPPSTDLARDFQHALDFLKPILAAFNLQFLPGGAHPWMDPVHESKRWPHDNQEIYAQYDKIFDCRGHGWANLQSVHVNLPFANDEEFKQLHNAIRLLLPLLPALAASTPFLEGKPTDYQCTRLKFYDENQARVPLISGPIIPEFIDNANDYQQRILQPMYEQIKAYDTEGLLQYEWLNSRAAIAKFDSQAIEIRILDSQECVNADIAIAKASWAILKNWIAQSDYFLQNPLDEKRLKSLYDQSKRNGLEVVVTDKELMRQWQLPSHPQSLQEIWRKLLEQCSHDLDITSQKALDYILTHGNLSSRLIKAHHQKPLLTLYRELGECLANNEQL